MSFMPWKFWRLPLTVMLPQEYPEATELAKVPPNSFWG